MNKDKLTQYIAIAAGFIVIGIIFGGFLPKIFVANKIAYDYSKSVDSLNMEKNKNSVKILEGQVEVVDLVVGDGKEAVKGSTVSLRYTLTVDGKIVDMTKEDAVFTFQLDTNQVILGFNEGVKGMKVGGERMLIIQPSAGFGSQEIQGAIPSGSVLIFEIELVTVN